MDQLKPIEKLDIILFLILILIFLLYVDFFDLNERFGFPINVLDEPLLVIIGIILGYLIAKFRFLRIIKKKLNNLGH